MDKRVRLLILYLLLVHVTCYSQRHDEKLYIQTDRNYYAKGETIHFKGYIMPGADTLGSTNLFLEIWDTTFKKLAAISVPVIEATSAGSITIPATLSANRIFLRAYTDITSLQDRPFQFIKPLPINTAKISTSETDQSFPDKPLFFPEGGKLVYSAMNYVAFRTAPDFSGAIRNSKGEMISSIKPSLNGMGLFRFRPLPGETYFCYWNGKGEDSIVALPVPVERGIALHVNQQNDTLFFEIDKGQKNSGILKPRVQLMVDNEIAYMIDLTMNGNAKFSYFIPLKAFQPGMAELRVLDDGSNMVASRPVFILGRRADRQAMDIVKKGLNKRGENVFRLYVGDTTLKYVSVSISDAAYNTTGKGFAMMSTLLPAGISSIPVQKDPGSYHELDLALLTMGDQPKPENIKPGTLNEIPIPYLQLSGIVKKGKKLIANKEVLVQIRSTITGKELYKVVTDEKGRFVLDGLILYGENFAHCRLPGSSDEELECKFTLSLPVASNEPGFFNAFREKVLSMINTGPNPALITASLPIQNIQEDTLIFSDKVIELEEAIVTSNTRQAAEKRLQEVEKKYTYGTGFGGYGTTAETLDVMNDPQAGRLTSIFVYMASKFHSIRLKYVRGREEMINLTRARWGVDTIIRSYYLDGNKINRDLVDGIRLNEVALIKYIPMLGIEPGMPPSIAIFLRKPGDLSIWEKEGEQVKEQKLTGYPVLKELPMPDYNQVDIRVKQDTRKSLLWQPYIKVNNGVAEIKFYNNDVTTRIKIVVEGISRNGNLFYFEKILE
jgi:hypothetical protein